MLFPLRAIPITPGSFCSARSLATRSWRTAPARTPLSASVSAPAEATVAFWS
ncbi:hypothetical protein GCM10023178_70340 [Actinomadura luteofluorescens]